MSAETIKFHGGPRHNQMMAIPSGCDDLEVEVVMTTEDRTRGVRTGHYTRVNSISGHPSHDFEWSGFTSPFVPQPLS
jgi:hypothetical protein